MHSLKYLKIKEWTNEVKQKMIAKEYKQCIYKEKRKVLLLALALKNTNAITRLYLQWQISK